MNLIPSVNSTSYTTSAFIIGLLLSNDLTPAEQNSLGNWFMLVGQTLCTSSSQQQVLNNRSNNSNNYNSHIINDNNLFSYKKHADDIKNTVYKIIKSD